MTHEAQRYQRLRRLVEREAQHDPPTYYIHPHARILLVLIWAVVP